MSLGGEQKRQELFNKISSNKMSVNFESMNLNQGFTEEEKKVAIYGEKGQGEYLTDAKRDRRK